MSKNKDLNSKRIAVEVFYFILVILFFLKYYKLAENVVKNNNYNRQNNLGNQLSGNIKSQKGKAEFIEIKYINKKPQTALLNQQAENSCADEFGNFSADNRWLLAF